MAEPGKPRLRFTADDRLRKSWEFRRVQAQGRKVHTPQFLLVLLPHPQTVSSPTRSRLGITVTRKVSPSAVKRNRVKRVVREVFRKNRELFPPSCDVVVIARRGAPALGYAEVLEQFRNASRPMHKIGKMRRAR